MSSCGVKRAADCALFDKLMAKRARVEDTPADARTQLLHLLLPSTFCESVMEIIDDLLISRHEATLKAARQGRVDWMQKLVSDSDCYYLTSEAALAAGTNGHVEMLKMIYDCPHFGGSKQFTAWQILSGAAARGDITMVKFVVTQVHSYGQPPSAALSHAIKRGDVAMADILLDPKKKFRWKYADAVNQAIAEGQDTIVGLMHQNYPFSWEHLLYDDHTRNETLIAYMARGGYADSVAYLYDKGLWDLDGMGDGFCAASKGGHNDTLEFLNGTGMISPQAFDKGFVAAANDRRVHTVKLLYSMQRASVEAINEAFLKTGSTEIAKVLYDTELILIDTLKTVFQANPGRKKSGPRVGIVSALVNERSVPIEVEHEAALSAASWGDPYLVQVFYKAQRYSNEEIIDVFKTAVAKKFSRVVKIVDDAECISDETREEAFLASAKQGHCSIVQALLQKPVSRKVITDAFVAAAKGWHASVVDVLLHDQQAPGEVIRNLFRNAVETGQFPVARVLIKSSHISKQIKDEALLTVPQRGKSSMEFIRFMKRARCWS